MGFLSSWSIEETVAKVRGLAVPDGGSRKTRRDIVETQGRSSDTRVIFHGLDATLAETMNSTQKKPDRVEAQELSKEADLHTETLRVGSHFHESSRGSLEE